METNNRSIPENQSDFEMGETESVTQSYAVAFVFPVLSICMIGVNILSFVVNKKCKRMSSQIKLLTQNIIVCDFTTHLVMLIGLIIVSNIAASNRVLAVNVFRVFFNGLSTLYTLSILLVAVDRFVSVRYSASYNIILPTRMVKKMIFSIYCLISGVVILATGSFIEECKEVMLHCSTKSAQAYRISKYICMSLFIISLLSIICLGTRVLNISKKQAKVLQARYAGVRVRKKFQSLRFFIHMAVYCCFNVVFNLPFLMFDSFGVNMGILVEIVMRLSSFLIIWLNSVLTHYYYVYILRESRFVFATIFCKWNAKFAKEMPLKRMKLYNIPLPERAQAGQRD